MPEGPSMVILKEAVQDFIGQKVISISGNTKVDVKHLKGENIIDFKTWGKHFLICFPNQTIRIHFLLFGSYRINEKKDSPARLSLQFKNGELNFYACSVRLIDEDLDEIYEWSADVMSNFWNAGKARRKLRANPDMLVCDALLDQNIFAGSGNIIKNEVLYRIHVHPKSLVGKLPPEKLTQLINQARIYSFDFFEWKKQYVLKKNWLAHTKKTCKRCNLRFTKEYLGKTNRRSFFCNNCQTLYI